MLSPVKRMDALRRPLGLACAFVAAKLALVLLKTLDGGRIGFAPVAFVFEDVLALACFAPLELLAWRVRLLDRFAWGVFAVVVGFTALNVPVARVFGTPLTAGMIGATGAALKDSIVVYVTLGNVLAVAAVIAAAYVGTRLRPKPRAAIALGALAAIVLVLGPWARARHAEDGGALGLPRNAVVTLVRTFAARARPTDALVAEAPITPEGRALDLTHLAGSAKGRSVVWIVLESTGARYLAPYGAPRDATPNLTRLAKEGLVFDSAYAVYPESIKGLYAALCSFAVARDTVASQYAAERRPCTSIAQAFKAAGYATALLHSGRFVYLGMEAIVRGRGFDALEDAASIPAKHVSSFGIDDASTARRALTWIDAQHGAPFFLVYMPIGGHHPYETAGEGPRPFTETYDHDRYANDLYRADHATGLLLEGLRARGLYERSVIVVNGDHGEAFFQHDGNFAHTLFVYEENVHVPLVITVPGVTTHLRPPQIASLVDLAPTMLDLAGVARPTEWEGGSLLAPTPRVARFFADQAIVQLGLRDGQWKAILDADTGRTQLFDLAHDPMEKNDVAARETARAERYRQHLVAWSLRQRARVAP